MNNQKLNNILKDPKTNWKYILIVVILAFVSGMGAWIYQSKQKIEIPQIVLPEKKDETANWKTYRNEEFGLEISYPEDQTRIVLENMPLEGSDLTLIRFQFPVDVNAPVDSLMYAGSAFDINVRPNQESVRSYIEEYKSQFDNPDREGYVDPSMCEEEQANIGAEEYPATILTNCSVFRNKFILLKHPNLRNMVIEVNRSYTAVESYEAIFNQILSTFRFIGAENEIVNWNTYRSEEYGFEVKYPSDFILQEFHPSLIQNQMFALVDFVRKDTINYPIIGISLANTAMTPKEWMEDRNYCPNSSISCSPLRSGPMSGSVQFDTLGRHYASTGTLFKNNSILFAIGLDATAPNEPISDVAYSIYGQILSTFRFLE